MKKFSRFLASRPLGVSALVILVFLYLLMAFAEPVAPYEPTTSFPEMTYHPPNLRLTLQGLQAQEARVINTMTWKYVLVKDAYHPVGFFVKGAPYKLFGFIPAERHLIGTKDGRYPVFVFGADNLGRDLFSRVVHGSRISLTIGFIATAISLGLAILFGGLAGYYGGMVDWAIMRFSEFFMLIPGLYLILFLRSLLSGDMDSGQSYMVITVILSLVGWPGTARTIRGLVHSIKREDFILNARLEGIPSVLIIFAHIIPQTASLLIVSIALSIPGFIMSETTLSYLGLGIVDPAVSWGSLIKRDISTLSNLRNFPWLLSPVWLLLTVTLAFNFLADTLRDFYDPYHAVFPRIRDKLFGKKTVPADDDALVHVCDLAVSFPRPAPAHGALQAVRGVSFSLRRGEILGIVGESGSGKSVTTSAIPGLLPKTAVWSGSVRYDGQELLGLPLESLRAFRGKKIGMIFQEPGRSYDPLQNMEKVFLETFRNSDPTMTREAARKKAVSLLEEVGLDRVEERLGNFPHQFSGGQLQRIGIALALAQGCELLIADEPTTALDVTIQAQIVALIKRIRDERKISVIFISHDIDLVAGISDRILVMYSGLIMEQGPARDVFASPAHPYTRALLAAAPRFETHYSRDPLDIISGRVPDPSNPPPACPFAPRCRYAAAVCREALPKLESLSESCNPAGAEHPGECCNPAGVPARDFAHSTPHRYRCVFTPEKQV